jgi:predicted MFS family arabinose efflux permease
MVAAALLGTGFMFVQMTMQNLVGTLAEPGRRPAAFLDARARLFGVRIDCAARQRLPDRQHRPSRHAVADLHSARRRASAFSLRSVNCWTRRRPAKRAANEPSNPFDLLRYPEVRKVLIASGMISMAWDLQSFLIPVYGTSIGLSASQIGLVLGSFAAATFTIRVAMPALARHFDEWQVITATLATAAIAFALMPLFKAIGLLMAVAFLLGLGLGAAQPNVMSLAA